MWFWTWPLKVYFQFCKRPTRAAAGASAIIAFTAAGGAGASTMYPNPFDRKHSTIRQILDRIFKDSRAMRAKPKLTRKDSSSSSTSAYSTSSSGSASSENRKFNRFSFRSSWVWLFSSSVIGYWYLFWSSSHRCSQKLW